MAICIVSAAKTLVIAANAFSLSWLHSVEKTEWQEDWTLRGDQLVLEMARVKGSGAGMEPGDNATLVAGWWQWKPHLPAIAKLDLAASGMTASGWKICDASGSCFMLGETQNGPIQISACKRDDG